MVYPHEHAHQLLVWAQQHAPLVELAWPLTSGHCGGGCERGLCLSYVCVLSIMHDIDSAVKITIVSTYNNTTLYICHIISTSDYRPALSLVRFTADFFERLSTFTYSFQESCSLYPRCTPYFSVEHTVSPQSVVSNTSSGCSVEYTILNLMRCRSYHSTATALLGNQRGNTVVVGDTVMLSE